MKMEEPSITELKPVITSSSKVEKISSEAVAVSNKQRSKSRTTKVSLTGATLKSILKKKGDETAGKRSISSRKSSIKFNRKVSSKRMSTSTSDYEDSSTTNLLRKTSSTLHDAEVTKNVIETTLLKSAEILSEFTENTITQAASYVNNFFIPDRIGINKLRQRRSRHRSWSGTASCASVLSVAEKVKPDISKLPPNIAELLKSDSDTSISSKKGNVRHYHTRKLALRQGSGSHNKSNPTVPIKVFADSRAPNIVVVSAPDPHKLEVSATKGDNMKKFAQKPDVGYKDEATDTIFDVALLESSFANSRKGKRAPNIPGTSNPKPLVRKPHKMHLGIEKGVVFIVGPKTKIPYINTFGEAKELNTLRDNPSNFKWILNIGNFHDEELSFSILERKLTITGFRHPTLRYPDGQTVAETIVMPPDFDVKNLRIYRPKGKNDLLVLEETDSTEPESTG